jgi:putative addiction module killer protein
LRLELRTIVEYIDAHGKVPFRQWFERLKDLKGRAAVDARMTRIRMGNLGHCRSVGHGVLELKIDFGPGYRVYFGQDGEKVIVLLVGGDKKSQAGDIKRAHEYWLDYTGA